MKRCVRVSSNVDLLPRRAATKACTLSSGCSCKAWNSISVLAKAYVSLFVVLLILRGGVTSNFSSCAANNALLISSLRSSLTSSSNSCLRNLTSFKWLTSAGASSTNLGSVYIRRVTSITLSSLAGKP